MSTPTSTEALDRLAAGYALDRLWGESMGLPTGDSKEKPLRLVAEILERECVPFGESCPTSSDRWIFPIRVIRVIRG